MNTTLRLKALGGALALAGICAAGASLHGRSAEIPEMAVSFADVNVGTREGASEVYARIKAAAMAVCGPALANPHREARRQLCIRHAIATAVASVDAPALSHYDRAASGGRLL